jgi:hypothetical protein
MMSEEEWLAGVSASRMLQTVNRYAGGRALARKCRLLTCHLLRRVARLTPDPQFLHAVEVAERHQEGDATLAEVAAAVHEASRHHWTGLDPVSTGLAKAVGSFLALQPLAGASSAAGACVWAYGIGRGPVTDASTERASAEIAPLIRCVFGNPFRQVAVAATWRTATAIGLARGMYDTKDFGAMPILADALEDAGCDAADVLAHCRDPRAGHVRGCWVVDQVLGRG